MINYPIILTNLNRLSTCKKMVEDLFKLNPNAVIHIIDNASTYPPLLEWYDQIKKDVNIIKNPTNLGPWSFFYSNHYQNINSDWYIYSDADLELNPEMPYNWQEIMKEYILKYDRKSSLALRIDDIPDHYPFKDKIKDHQSVCWYPTDEADVYKAITDMTFTMDRKDKGYRYESMRLAGKFLTKHVPWYIDFDNIEDEEKYYLENMNRNFNDALYSSTHYDYLKTKQ
jgi:hypothetical protein